MLDPSCHSTFSTSPENPTQSQSRHRNLLALSLLTIAIPATAQTAGTYAVTNLISDGSVPATITDANFINPWGITNATFWINAQATGFDYVVSPTNFPPFTPPATPAVAFKISIPPATGGATATGSPTGAASTGTATGFLLPNGTKATFLFASLDGIITGWNSKLGTAGAVAQVAINNSTAGAVYTDMALVANTNGTYILAANFGKAAAIEVYDSNFAPAKLAGSFTDTTLPAGYVPYSVHVIGTQVFVTYALRATTGGPTVAPGNGVVNVFDINGNFVAHAITPGGNLNARPGDSPSLLPASASSAEISSLATLAMASSTSTIPKPSPSSVSCPTAPARPSSTPACGSSSSASPHRLQLAPATSTRSTSPPG
jgi:uncharacterized protein (TIGR03118 family)